MTIYPKQIMDALATVRYPGTGKNVVEMQMVEDDLRIAGLHVSFTLIFDKPTDPFLKSMVKACEAAIHAYVGKEVEVEVKTRTLQAPRPDLPHLLPGVKNIIAVSSGKGGVGKWQPIWQWHWPGWDIVWACSTATSLAPVCPRCSSFPMRAPIASVSTDATSSCPSSSME